MSQRTSHAPQWRESPRRSTQTLSQSIKLPQVFARPRSDLVAPSDCAAPPSLVFTSSNTRASSLCRPCASACASPLRLGDVAESQWAFKTMRRHIVMNVRAQKKVGDALCVVHPTPEFKAILRASLNCLFWIGPQANEPPWPYIDECVTSRPLQQVMNGEHSSSRTLDKVLDTSWMVVGCSKPLGLFATVDLRVLDTRH